MRKLLHWFYGSNKVHTASPVNNPSLANFTETLQYKDPDGFVVATSLIPNAHKGVFVLTSVEKGQKLCGYPGQVHAFNSGQYSSNYTAKINRTKFVIDAGEYKHLHDPLYVYISRGGFFLARGGSVNSYPVQVASNWPHG
jgi:hypothetical protein